MPRLSTSLTGRFPALKLPLIPFSKIPIAVSAVLLYTVTLYLVISSNEPPPIPPHSQRLGMDLDVAWTHLHTITERPHPYNSHANDYVRDYIGSYLYNITFGLDFVEIDNDEETVARWNKNSKANYFEGNNIVVKIQGTHDLPEEDDRGGVLFSAHFDSVATAPGVTDDGMATSALIEFIRYLTQHRPSNTAIFNINNGEEDGLHGAYAFLNHKWAKIPATFFNIEGAGAGGIPQLFRSTRYAPVYAFRRATHPSGSSVARDAFASGLIRSDTDFSVYQTIMEGVDVAFYKPRSRYHTKYDSIPGADASSMLPQNAKRSLWNLMQLVREVGEELLHEGLEYPERSVDPVFFDLLGSRFFVFNSDFLLAFDGLLLLLGPVVLYLLRAPATQAPSTESTWSQHLERLANREWLRLEWIQDAVTNNLSEYKMGSGMIFCLSLFATFLAQAVFAGLILRYNPFIIHNNATLVVVTQLCLAYLFLVKIPGLFSPLALRDPRITRIVYLKYVYMVSWVLLLGATIALWKYTLCGTFVVTIYQLHVALAALLAYVEARRRSPLGLPVGESDAEIVDDPESAPVIAPTERTPLLNPTSLEPSATYGAHENGGTVATNGTGHGASNRLHQHDTREPLAVPPVVIAASQVLLFVALPLALYETLGHGAHPKFVYLAVGLIFATALADPDSYIDLWLVQLLLIVPIPVAVLVQTLYQFIVALNQTLVDGSNPLIVYAGSAILCILIVLPLLPFAVPFQRPGSPSTPEEALPPTRPARDHDRSRFLLYPASLGFMSGLLLLIIYLLFAFPFSQSDPLVVSFYQDLQIDLGSRNDVGEGGVNREVAEMSAREPRTIQTTLIGANGFLHGPHRSIVDALPSVQKAGPEAMNCTVLPAQTIQACQWRTTGLKGFDPAPGRWVGDRSRGSTGTKRITTPGDSGNNPSSLPSNQTGLLPSSNPRWFDVQIKQGPGPKTATFVIDARNTRRCQIDFENHPILWYRVSDHREPNEATLENLHEASKLEWVSRVDIWRRERDSPFSVIVGWDFPPNHVQGDHTNVLRGGAHLGPLQGRVGCWWSEYESGMIGLPNQDGEGVERPRIPAYEEILDDLPLWAVSRGRHKDLVQVWGEFYL